MNGTVHLYTSVQKEFTEFIGGFKVEKLDSVTEAKALVPRGINLFASSIASKMIVNCQYYS